MDTAPGIVLWGTFAIAVLGVVQPYAYALWRRYYRARRIAVYHSLKPDLGFAGGGLSFGLAGTIAVSNAASLITKIVVRATRAGDPDGQAFDATFNRERTLSNEEGGKESGKVWVPFQAAADAAYPYDILFYDADVNARLETLEAALRSAWQSFALPRMAADVRVAALDDAQRLTYTIDLNRAFQAEAAYAESARMMRECLYWRAGEYALTMDVYCAEDSRGFRQAWRFVLTAEQAAALDANVEKLQAFVCDIPAAVVGAPAFVYPALERGASSTVPREPAGVTPA